MKTRTVFRDVRVIKRYKDLEIILQENEARELMGIIVKHVGMHVGIHNLYDLEGLIEQYLLNLSGYPTEHRMREDEMREEVGYQEETV